MVYEIRCRTNEFLKICNSSYVVIELILQKIITIQFGHTEEINLIEFTINKKTNLICSTLNLGTKIK